MELTNEFTVDVPLERAWSILTDVERIAPCLPGAELREVEGDEYRGVVKVKVGPIATSYEGVARFVERDEAVHRVVLRAEGRETRGQGNASATVTATMSPSSSGTSVSVVTDLSVSGKVAQFGRGVMADVSAKLLTQFVDNLEATVLATDDEASTFDTVDAQLFTSSASRVEGEGVREIHSTPAEPVDVMALAGGSVMRRVVPAMVALGALVAVIMWLRRR
jgi:carbon monoxide dehydrogenase subunit G